MVDRLETQKHPYDFSPLVLLLYALLDGLSEGKRPDKHIKEHKRRLSQAYETWDKLKATSAEAKENLSESIADTARILIQAYQILSEAEKTWVDSEEDIEYAAKTYVLSTTGENHLTPAQNMRHKLYKLLWVFGEKISVGDKMTKLLTFLSQLDKGFIRIEEPKEGNYIPVELNLSMYPEAGEEKRQASELKKMARQFVVAQIVEIVLEESKTARQERKRPISFLNLPEFYESEVERLLGELEKHQLSKKSSREIRDYLPAKLAEEWQERLEYFTSNYYTPIMRLRPLDEYFDQLLEKYQETQKPDYDAISETLDIQFHLQRISANAKALYTSEKVHTGLSPAAEPFMKKAVKHITESCRILITKYSKHFSSDELKPFASFVKNTQHLY